MAIEWAKRLLLRLVGKGHGNDHADSCCRGHRLKPFRTPIPGYRCSSCRKTLPASTVVQACRPCDYDLCTPCFARRRGPGPGAHGVAWLRSQGAISANRVLRAAVILGLLYALRYTIEFAAVPLLAPGRQQQGLSWLKGGSQNNGSSAGEGRSGWQLTVRVGLSLPATVRRSVRLGVAAASQGVANVHEALLVIVAWGATILSMVADAWTSAWQWVYVHVAIVHHMITHWVTSVATVVYAKTLASVLVLFNACGGPVWVEARPWAVELSLLAAQALQAIIAVVSWAVKSVYTEKMGEVAITIILVGGILSLKVAACYAANTACRIIVFLGIEAGVVARELWKRVFLPPPPPPMSSSEAQAAALVAVRQKRCLAAGLPIASGGIDRFRAAALKVVSLNRQATLVALLTKQKRVSVKYLASAGGRGHLSSGVPNTPATIAATASRGTAGLATGLPAGSAAADGSSSRAHASSAATLGEWGRGAIVEMRDPATSHAHHRHSTADKQKKEDLDDDAPRLTGYAFANCGGSLDVRFPLRGEAWALAVPTDKLVWPQVVLPSALTPYPQPGEPAAANATAMVATTAAAASAVATPMTPREVKTLASARSETLVAHRRAAQAAVQAEALSMASNAPNQVEDSSGMKKKKVSALPLGALVEARWRGVLGDTSPATISRATWEVRNHSDISFNGTTPEGHHSFATWVRLGAAVSAQTSRYDRALSKAAIPRKSNTNANASSMPEAKEKRTSTSKKRTTFATRAASTDNDNDDDDSGHDADDDIAAGTATANASKTAAISSAVKSSVPVTPPKVRAALHSAAAAFAASGAARRKVSFKEKVYDNSGAWRYDVHYADGSSELAVAAADLRRYYPYYVEDLGVRHKAQGRFMLVYDPDYHTHGHAHSQTNALTSYRHSGRSSSNGGTSPRSAPVVVEWDWFWLKAMSAVVAGLAMVLEHGKDYWNAYTGVHPCIVAAYQQAGVPSIQARQPKQQQQKPPSSHTDADANNVDISAFVATSSRAVVTYVARFSVRLGAAAAAAANLALEPPPGDSEASPRSKRYHSSSSYSSEANGGGWYGSSRRCRREDLFSQSTGAPPSSGSERGPWFVAASICVSSHGLLVVTSTMSLMVAVILVRRVVAVGGLRECMRRPGLIFNGRKHSIIEKATAVATAAEGAGTPTKKGDVGTSSTSSEGLPTGEVVRFASLSELEGLRVFVRHRGRAIERAATIQRAYFAPVAAINSANGISGARRNGSNNGYSSSNSHGSSSVAFAAVRAATVASNAFHRLQHLSRVDTLRFDVLYDSGKMLTEHMHEHGHHKLRQESETSVPASCLRVAGPPPKLPVLPPLPPKNALKSFALTAAANNKKKMSASLDAPSTGAKLLLARAGASLYSAPPQAEENHCPAGHPTKTTEATVTSKPCFRCFRKLPVGAKLASCSECHVSYCFACVRHLALPPRAHGSAADRPIEESEAILKGASQRKRGRFVNYVAKTSSVLEAMQGTSHRTPLAKASQMDIGDPEGPDEIPHLSQMASLPLLTLSSRFSKFN